MPIDSSTITDNKSTAARLLEMALVFRRNGIIHGVTPGKLKLILEELGPTFVKLGQLMSMRTDILPQEYCAALALLRTDVRPMSYEEVIRVVESEYGAPPAEIFQEISREFIGAASIAQVHKAVLKNGQTVVLKVQRPGIYKTMERDIQLLKKTITLVRKLNFSIGDIDFRDFVDEMWAAAQQEMDFLAEANYIREFTELNADIKYVAFPQVERDLTTPRVLVMEYIDGIPIDHLEKLKALGYDIDEISMKLAENYVKQIIDDGLFHADPHPGNIFIRDGKIVWIDLGMVGRINNRDRMLLRKIILSVVQQDIQGLKDIFLTLDTIKGKVNHTKLYEDIESLLTRYGDMDLEDLNLGKIMEEVKVVLDFHQITLPKGIAMLGRGIITIEGVLAVCSPQVNFMQIMANNISGSLLKQFDLKQALLAAAVSLNGFAKNSLILPEQLSNVLKMAIRGQTKINIELTSADEPARQAGLLMDKLTISILSASVVIGSSIICTADITPRVLGIPVLGLAGLIIGFLMAAWLVTKILRKK
jgi:ubiquinone biosynthesis protein